MRRIAGTIRGHEATILAIVISLIAVLNSFSYAVHTEGVRDEERVDRVIQINKLACAIEVDARGTLLVIATRAAAGLPGDDLLARNKTRLALAAGDLNPNCVLPKELR